MNSSENSSKRRFRNENFKNKRGRLSNEENDQNKDNELDNEKGTYGNDYFDRLYELGLLQKILKYLQSRTISSMVCQAFYKASAALDDEADIYKLNISKYTSLKDVFDSIMHSQRNPRVLNFESLAFAEIDEGVVLRSEDDGNFKRVLNIVKKFKNSIEVLSFNRTIFLSYHIMTILQCIHDSKLTRLNITNSGILIEKNAIDELTLTKDMLPCLTSINMMGTKLGNSPHAPQMQEILLKKFFEMLATKQTKLQELVVMLTVLRIVPIEKFRHLKTFGILKIYPMDLRLATEIHGKSQLTHLNILGSFIMDDVIMEILNLNQLKTLKINCEAISLRIFAKLASLMLNELHLEVNRQTHWITSALPTISFNLEKFALIIPNLKVSVDSKQASLREMIPKDLKELQIVTSQLMALQSILTSEAIKTLTSISIEIVKDWSRASQPDLLFKQICIDNHVLENLIIINRNPKIFDMSNQLVIIFEQCPSIRVLYIEGFDVTEALHMGALHYLVSIEDLTLKCRSSQYTISNCIEKLIEDCLELKKMTISCVESNYHDFLRFPIELQKGNEIIYRYR